MRLVRLLVNLPPLMAAACSGIASTPENAHLHGDGGRTSAPDTSGSSGLVGTGGQVGGAANGGNDPGASGSRIIAGAAGASPSDVSRGGSAGAEASSAGSGGSGGSSLGTGGVGGSGGSANNAGGSGSQEACTTGSRVAQCKNTNAKEIACHFGGDPGNYTVSVALGGKSAGDMYVEAESYRRMLGEVTTAAEQTKAFRFVVNVRQPEGQPIQNGPSDGTAGLDIYIRGTAPELSTICYEPARAPAMIWIGGDSTVCDQSGTDYSGWGQHLPQFLNSPAAIANYADSGESSGSFLNSASLFGAIKARWHAGDWFFLQLGHNDKDTTEATFKANMESFVTQAKSAGVNIVLVTPISRVGSTLASEHVNSTGANLPQIIRDLGKSQNVPVIDLTVTTWNWLQTIEWQDYFALGTDHTHTNPKGADVIAGFVRDAIRAQKLAIDSYLR